MHAIKNAAPAANGGRQINRHPQIVYAAPTLAATFDDLAVEAQTRRSDCERDLLGRVLSRPADGWNIARNAGLELHHFAHRDSIILAAAIDVLHRLGRLQTVGIDWQRSRFVTLARHGLEDAGMGWYWPVHELHHLSRKFPFKPAMIVMHVEHLIDLGERIADAERGLRFAYRRLLGKGVAA